MTREELIRLLEGTSDPAERARICEALMNLNDETRAQLETAWQPKSGPDVFEAAYEATQPVPAPWWRRVVLPLSLATAATVAFVMFQPTPPSEVGVKGPIATPSLGMVLVVLNGPTHRLAADEALQPGTRLGVRVTTSQAAWVGLEEFRGDAWVRLWPADATGALLEAGEHELGDAAGAVVLRVDPRDGPWQLRLVGAVQPLDVAKAPGQAAISVQVAR